MIWTLKRPTTQGQKSKLAMRWSKCTNHFVKVGRLLFHINWHLMIFSWSWLGDRPVPPKENVQSKVKKIQGFQIKCVNENILCVQKRLPYYFNWGSIWARWLGPHEEIDWPQHLSSRLQQCFLFLFLISQSGKLLLIKTHFTLEKQVLSRFFFSILFLQNRENSPQENQGIPLY